MTLLLDFDAETRPPIANVIISNVPGPQVPLYAAGARMRTYWPMSIPEHGVGLNITVMSYAGAMGFGFTAARNAVPDARALATALQEALDELVARTKSPRARRAGASQGRPYNPRSSQRRASHGSGKTQPAASRPRRPRRPAG